MKFNKKIIGFLSILIYFSFIGLQNMEGQSRTNILPLTDGWYLFNFERTFKNIQDEFDFAQSMGLKMRSEVTWKYTGVVVRYENGALFDPLMNMEFSIDRNGIISSANNLSIKGTVDRNGHVFWSGLGNQHGRTHSIFTRGTLTPLPVSARGGPQFNGVYHMIDSGTGRRQLVRVQDGFYTWRYIDDEETGFTPWPTLIMPDGTFSGGLEITTSMEMENISRVDYSTLFSYSGKITPGQGITMEEISRTTGMGNETFNDKPQIYAGTMIRSGEFPNTEIPPNIETLVQTGRQTARAETRPNTSQYPAWYVRPPVKAGFIYATGEKTFDNRDVAFAIAEAAAAASLAEQIRVQIINQITDRSSNRGTMSEEQIRSQALERLNYTIIERHYNDRTNTAFVLAEMRN